MLNKAMIIGRLGRDPELRYTQSGVPVTTLNVATGETFVDRDGNKNEITEWHRVSVFQRQAENCVKYLRKGSLVYVEGSLQTRKWQDAQGIERSATVIRAVRVTFLEKKSDTQREGYSDAGFPPSGENDYDAGGLPSSQFPYDNAKESENRDFAQPVSEAPVYPSEANDTQSSSDQDTGNNPQA